jgi:hypothetical protein
MWAIALSSIFLIILPLFGPLGIDVNISRGLLNIAQVTAAMLILIVSIVVHGSKFGTRAADMHRCGLELNALRREIYLLIANEENDKKIRAAQRAYDEIMLRYDNHSQLDFRWAQITKAPDYYRVGLWHRSATVLRTAVEYSPYLLLVLAFGIFVGSIVQ